MLTFPTGEAEVEGDGGDDEEYVGGVDEELEEEAGLSPRGAGPSRTGGSGAGAKLERKKGALSNSVISSSHRSRLGRATRSVRRGI